MEKRRSYMPISRPETAVQNPMNRAHASELAGTRPVRNGATRSVAPTRDVAETPTELDHHDRVASEDPRNASALAAALVAAQLQISDLSAKLQKLEGVLTSRYEVSIATGILMQHCGYDRESAFETLRTRARSERRRLQDVANELIEAVETVNRLSRPR